MTEYNSGKDLQLMIDKYVSGTATDEEIEFVESYYAHAQQIETAKLSDEEIIALQKSTFAGIDSRINRSSAQQTIKIYKYASVAATLLLICTVAYFLRKGKPDPKNSAVAVHPTYDVKPGTNKATLMLGNGLIIALDDKAVYQVKKLSGIAIQTGKGQLTYLTTADSHKNYPVFSNTVITPKGGQYQIILPDGTHVWLNAASSLTYPEVFTGNKRTVKLQGEGYFEVAKNKAMPFHVATADQDVEVTGTHFNINSYQDNRSTKTTLLEGSVTVSSQNIVKVLLPGQQTSVYTNLALITVKPVDTEEEIAWKNGLFQFNNTSLINILNQLERWYNVKVNYTNLPFKRYNGMISRSANLSEVLKMLELTGNIKFKIEENRELKVSNN